MNMHEAEELSDDSEIDAFIESSYHTRSETKFQRIVKTYLINFSFIALVSEQIGHLKIFSTKNLSYYSTISDYNF